MLGVVVLFVPFTQWNLLLRFPSCGFVYYLVIGFAGMVSYTWIARKYQYRQRDEPDNIYCYAEEYYAIAQDEPTMTMMIICSNHPLISALSVNRISYMYVYIAIAFRSSDVSFLVLCFVCCSYVVRNMKTVVLLLMDLIRQTA